MVKLIHQTWKTRQLPTRYAAYVNSWKALHPEWRHILWSDADNRDLLQRFYPWFLRTYEAYPYDIQRADAIRYFILHRHGGVYADLDYEVFEPLDAACATKQALFVERCAGGPSNFLMYSGERRAVWERIIQSLAPCHEQMDYARHRYTEQVLGTTGPVFLAAVLGRTQRRRAFGLFPAAEYDPYDRFQQAWPAGVVRRRLRALKGASDSTAGSGRGESLPAALQQRLAGCKGVHWRVASWVRAYPAL